MLLISQVLKFTLIIVAAVILTPAQAAKHKKLIVAVIDTGFGYNGAGQNDYHLCPKWHRDLVGLGTYEHQHTVVGVPLDTHGHGTNVVGLIERYAGLDVDYCVVIIKFYDDRVPGISKRLSSVAINYARKIHADVINISAGGYSPSDTEQRAVKKYLDQGGSIFAAAGNNGVDLGLKPYYPAMSDPRVNIVGAFDENLKMKTSYSNYKKDLHFWEIGTNLEAYGITMTGTSQATAVATGKWIARHQMKEE